MFFAKIPRHTRQYTERETDMTDEREEISCECQEIHEDLLKIVNETMPDEEELYDLADLFKLLGV